MAKKRLTAQKKREVEQRAGGCCEYCRSQGRFATEAFSAEHIVPRSRGGETSVENMAFSCQGCNNFKYTKTKSRDPETKRLAPLFHPRKHLWRDHFAWSQDYTLIIGLTATGRATVEALHLNRQSLVNLRQILFTAGEHPPPEPEP